MSGIIEGLTYRGRMSTFFVFLLYGLWSSVFAVGKEALEIAPPLFLTASRMILAGVVILGYLAIRNRSAFQLNKKKWISIGILSVLSIYLTNVLEFWGLQYLSAAKACFIYGLSPFFAAFFSYLHFKEKMNLRKWLGLAIGFVGFIPVLISQTGSEELLNAVGFLTWPTLAIMAAALFSIYGWVLLRVVVKDNEMTPLFANGSSMLIGGLIALVHSFFVDSWNPIPVAEGNWMSFSKLLLLMTALYNIICYNLYGLMLKRFTATFMSFAGLLSPIFASIFGKIFLDEPISWTIIASTGIISIGLFVVYQAELKQGYIVRKTAAEKSS